MWLTAAALLVSLLRKSTDPAAIEVSVHWTKEKTRTKTAATIEVRRSLF